MRIKGLKQKKDILSPPRGIVGVVSNLLKGSRGSKLRHSKDEFAMKQFKGLHGSLSFEDLEALQFQEDLQIGGSVVA